MTKPDEAETRARSIYAAGATAQLFARVRADIALFDAMIKSYQGSRLLPE